MNSQWSDNLRKTMETHEEPSPDGLWEDIEQVVMKDFLLQRGERPLFSAPRHKKTVLWIKRTGAVAAVLLVLFFAGDFLLRNDSQDSPAITQRPEAGHKPANNLTTGHNTEGILLSKEISGEYLFPDNNTVAATVLASTASTDRKTDEILIPKEKDIRENDNQIEETGKDSAIQEKADDGHDVSKDQQHDYHIPAPEPNVHYPAIKRRNKSARWQTGLYASNSSSGSSNTYNGYRSFLSAEMPMEEGNTAPLLLRSPHAGIAAANQHKEVHTEAKHRQPLTMGASIKYHLDEKWSLTSGLTYTILSSQLQSGTDGYYYMSEQTLHNIGIPLGINYNLWKSGNISIYLSGGGMVEKNVSGKLATDYVVNGKVESVDKENISIDRLQWSINTSAGVEYNLFPQIGLYAEPGVVYYFKNGSDIETIYKEKPVNVNLRVGLRFSLGE